MRMMSLNENKMSDGGLEHASLGENVSKSSQNVDAQRSAVRSIAWLDGWVESWVKDEIGLSDENAVPILPMNSGAHSAPSSAVSGVFVLSTV